MKEIKTTTIIRKTRNKLTTTVIFTKLALFMEPSYVFMVRSTNYTSTLKTTFFIINQQFLRFLAGQPSLQSVCLFSSVVLYDCLLARVCVAWVLWLCWWVFIIC